MSHFAWAMVMTVAAVLVIAFLVVVAQAIREVYLCDDLLDEIEAEEEADGRSVDRDPDVG